MPPIERRFDTYLSAVSQSELKSIARIWGARSAEPFKKEQLIAIIQRGLADPERVRAAIEMLTPFEHAALALLRWAGHPLEGGALTVALRAADAPLPKPRSAYDQDSLLILQPLIRRGLMLNLNLRDPSSHGSSYERAVLFSDSRLLEHATPFRPVPLPLQPAGPPERTLLRRPSTVVLDVTQLLQRIGALGKLNLTKQGTLRAADIRRLAKAAGWAEDVFILDGLPFPRPATAFAAALEAAGLLASADDTLFLSDAALDFGQLPYAEQVRVLLGGFIRMGAWAALYDPNEYFGSRDRLTRGQLALMVALAALPDAGAFFRLDDLEQALFARIGERFSLFYDPEPHYRFGRDPKADQREEQQWRQQLRSGWRGREWPQLAAAFTTWLYYLGVVELGFVDDQLVSIRLTELGQAVLAPEAAVPAEQAAAGPAWLVQPDFEIVVYLDHAAAGQITFVERHAERIQAQSHIARYRLTRGSIYRGLESGTTIDELEAGLRAGAGSDLPQNVTATIREWAAQRERITLRRRAHLLEFADPAARQRVLAGGIAGMPLGERFILLDTLESVRLRDHTSIDYAQDLPRCLSVTEEGVIKIVRPVADLALRPQLEQWAEEQPDGSWHLNPASVTRALRDGATITQLITLLQVRLTHRLPQLLGVALRAWAGKTPAVGLADVTVLYCSDPALFAAIRNSTLLNPYLRGALAPDMLLVDRRQLPALRERLAWAGFEIDDDIVIEE